MTAMEWPAAAVGWPAVRNGRRASERERERERERKIRDIKILKVMIELGFL